MRKYFGMAAVLLAAQILYSCSNDVLGYGEEGKGQIVARIAQPATTRTAMGNAVDGRMLLALYGLTATK